MSTTAYESHTLPDVDVTTNHLEKRDVRCTSSAAAWQGNKVRGQRRDLQRGAATP